MMPSVRFEPTPGPPRVMLAMQCRARRGRLEDALRVLGADVRTVGAGRALLKDFSLHAPHGIVIEDGYEDLATRDVCDHLGRRAGAVVIVLGVAGAARRAVLNEGADDALPLDCSADDVLARLRAVQRRMAWTAPQPSRPQPYRFEGHAYDPLTRRLSRPDGEVNTLSVGVADALLPLLENAGAAVSQSVLEARLTDSTPADLQLYVRIHRLRKALGAPLGLPDRLRVVRGRGYLLDVSLDQSFS